MEINIVSSPLTSGPTAASNLEWRALMSSPIRSSPSHVKISPNHQNSSPSNVSVSLNHQNLSPSHHVTISSNYQNSAHSSPISPFIQSPLKKPNIYASPTNSTPSSPLPPISSSPSSYRVSHFLLLKGINILLKFKYDKKNNHKCICLI